jgi:hypothetical protein
MDIIYIILVHKYPEQFKRLTNRLKAPNVYFYVHLDSKANIDQFNNEPIPNLFFIKDRVNCIWGDFSIVQATLNLIKCVLNDKKKGMVILLSGQDYPIKNQKIINNFFTDNIDYNFIDLNPINKIWSEKECNRRIKKFRINFSSKKNDFCFCDMIDTSAWFELTKYHYSLLKTISLLKKRNLNMSIEFVGGSQWWAFNTNTLKLVYNFAFSNMKLIRYFRFTHCADEIFFHTIVNHLCKIDHNIKISDTITYVNWSRSADGQSPVVLQKEDYEELGQQNSKLFARKFDYEIDCKILDALDKM